MKIGVFLEPPDDLRDVIADFKSRIVSSLGDVPLASHPVHCTLLAFRSGRVEEALHALAPVQHANGPFMCATRERLHVFENDPLTSGQTLVVLLERNPRLFRLQQRVADLLQPLVVVEEATDFTDKMDSEQRRSSERFGYPFVGEHWIPHFTIASPRLSLSHPIISSAFAVKWKFEVQVDRIGVWAIRGDKHSKLGEVRI